MAQISCMISLIMQSLLVIQKRFTVFNGTAHFCIFIDYRGHHRKGVAIYSATLVNLQQKLWFHWTQIVLFEHNREIQARKTQLIDIIFAMKKKSADLFRAAPYMLMLVLHKDALFSRHFNYFFLTLMLNFKQWNLTYLGGVSTKNIFTFFI